MPERINHTAANLFIAGSKNFYLLVFPDNSSSIFTTYMKCKQTGISAVGSMTVYTVGSYISVFDYGRFFEIAEITLVYAHNTEGLISRGDKAVCYAPFFYWVIADVNGERLVFCPLAVFPYRNYYQKAVSTIGFYQRVPFFDIKVCVDAIGMQLLSIVSSYHNICEIYIFVINIEIQWSYFGGDCDTDIVGTNIGQKITLRRALWQ